MMSFAFYTVATAYAPLKSMQRLLGEPRPLLASARAVGFVGVLYALTSIVLALVGAVPLAPVFIGLRPENYYVWQMIFVVPCILLAWGLATAVVLGPRKRWRGRTAVKKTVALTGVALAGSLFIAWVPTAIETVFMVIGMGQVELVELLSRPGGWQALYVGLHILAGMAAAVLLTLAAGQGCLPKAGRGRTGAVGIAAAALAAVVFILFIR
ncbi:MAG: hypothetical protein ABSG19_07805 [Candidatus Aminicenantales bacterium]